VKCPVCGAASSVIESRKTMTNVVRRRRECVKNFHRWTTFELNAKRLDQLQLAETAVKAMSKAVRERS
jgi:transcriptional regulator NrdR family protein